MEGVTKDYVNTAHAKRASRSRVSPCHALPNTSLPIITLLGTRLPRFSAPSSFRMQALSEPNRPRGEAIP
jgi:ABC-type dipeptide/oligopeptide/nickel transport system permease subunit